MIERFTAPDNPPWKALTASSQEVYRRRFDWLRERYGTIPLATFDAKALRRIRDQLKDKPSVGNSVICKLGQLWRWAVEHTDLDY